MKILLGTIVALTIVLSVVVAQAREAFTANTPQLGAFAGYGMAFEAVGGRRGNYYGLELGADGGYTTRSGLHIGGRFEYFFGVTHEERSVALFPTTFTERNNFWNLMAELGYDAAVSDILVVRPQVGFGLAEFNEHECAADLGQPGSCHRSSLSYLAAAPGVMFLVNFGRIYGVGGLRYQHVFPGGDNGNGDGVLVSVGVGTTLGRPATVRQAYVWQG